MLNQINYIQIYTYSVIQKKGQILKKRFYLKKLKINLTLA